MELANRCYTGYHPLTWLSHYLLFFYLKNFFHYLLFYLGSLFSLIPNLALKTFLNTTLQIAMTSLADCVYKTKFIYYYIIEAGKYV